VFPLSLLWQNHVFHQIASATAGSGTILFLIATTPSKDPWANGTSSEALPAKTFAPSIRALAAAKTCVIASLRFTLAAHGERPQAGAKQQGKSSCSSALFIFFCTILGLGVIPGTQGWLD
jgi:hypothetical protein